MTISSKNKKLVKAFLVDIERIDDILSIKDFAEIVSYIVVTEYGTHNYDAFQKIIKKHVRK